jgi:hypothetical protein
MTYRILSMVPIAAVFAGACDPSTAPTDAASSINLVRTATASVFATGLEYPRGFTFGPDGTLYVAEAGTAGTAFTTPERCPQADPPVGPYHNGPTGRISRIDRDGHRTTFAEGFPSAINQFGDVQSVADLAFLGDKLYALIAGGGCSHGSPDVPAGVAQVNRSGGWTIAADLSAFQAANPVANPGPPGDFEPDGSWYSLIRSGKSLIAVEPNHGEVVRIHPSTGAISRIIDVSATQGHIVPTVIVQRGDAFYLSNLGVFPVVPGLEKVFRLSPSGELTVVADGFTTVLGLAFDRAGRLYVLESSSVAGFPTPGTGRVIQVDQQGNRVVVVDGLFLPTGLRFGPDGLLYISNKGFGPPQPGEILRANVQN